MVVLAIFSLSSCEDEDPYTPSNYSSLYTRFTLGGQTWVMTQYYTGDQTTPTIASDTLVFSDTTHYTWNGIPSTYNYYYFDGAYYSQFSFKNSPFGPIIADVPDHFETFGQLNGAKFVFGFPSNSIYYYLWLKKI
jgi:hypothetical protein